MLLCRTITDSVVYENITIWGIKSLKYSGFHLNSM